MNTGAIRIYAWPRSLMGNPYPDLFYEAVSSQKEIEVLPLRWRARSICRAIVDTTRPKWIHFHWVGGIHTRSRLILIMYWLAIVSGFALLKAGGAKIVWTVHNVWPHDSRYPTIDRLGYKVLLKHIVDKVVAHSRYTISALRTEYGWDGDALVVPHGHYIDAYPRLRSIDPPGSPAQRTISTRTILFFGTLAPYKGLDDLIRAFKMVRREQNVRLMIVGRGEEVYVSSLRELVKGCEDIVIRNEFVPDDMIYDLFSTSDVVVLPYKDITTSGSLVLAFSAARAVVAPAIGSIPEYVDATCGVLYTAGDALGLARALSSVVTLDLFRMGKEARSRAESWSWGWIACEFVDYLKSHSEPASMNRGCASVTGRDQQGSESR